MGDFLSGTELQLTNGDKIVVREKLGEGGQGAVYKVNYCGQDYALKWYLPGYLKGLKPNCQKFYKNLVDNVSMGSPSPSFLWQKAIAITGKQSEGFGYIMDLRPPKYEEFTKFIKARVFFSSTEAVIRAAINVVEAFQALHRKGLSYQDLSPGNFFINKDTGDILICDNDNVAPYGENLGVGGTPGYMAPEVVLGTAKPSTDTDLFSLSVILFELFFLSHPLEGANCCKYPCLTTQIERDLYANNPIFVMSKTNGNNRPVKGVHSNLIKLWPVFPKFLHDAFSTAFDDGMKDPKRRLTESQWKDIIYRLLDNAVVCPKCKEINFADNAENDCVCCTIPSCGKRVPLPPRAVVGKCEIVADTNKSINEYHLSYGSHDKVIGTFIESKKNVGVWGLKNQTSDVWMVQYPGKSLMQYESGKVVTVIPDTVITVGNKQIIIKKA